LAEPTETRPAGGIGAAIAAANARQRRSLLRGRGGHTPVTNLELFFDLVFVFAVTQLSHFLLGELTPLGALRTAVLFAAVWWAWMWTTWATNWIDPDKGEVRLLIGALMLSSLVMAAAIPHGFGDGALIFALAYVTIQVGRCLFVSWAMEREAPGRGRNMLRASIWFLAATPFWLAGALCGDAAWQLGLWIAALTIEYASPLTFMWVPGLGRSSPEEWEISGAHMAERCALFIIIALGEGLVLTGATYSAAPPHQWLDAALVTAFAGSFLMWWLYFDMGARRGALHIENHALPGLVGRQAFTYWHIPIVAGIVVLAVADELVLAHPHEPVHLDFLAIGISGAALFIGGLAGFKRISSDQPWYPASHAYTLYLLVPLAVWGWLGHPTMLAFYGAIVVLFAVIGVWEWVSFHGGWLERIERRNGWLGQVLRRRLIRLRERRLSQAAARRR